MYNTTVTTIEVMPEDAQGNEVTRQTQHAARHVLVAKSGNPTTTGLQPNDKTVTLIDPDGWGIAWSLKAGDRIVTPDGAFAVSSATPIRSPRTNNLRHIEAVAG